MSEVDDGHTSPVCYFGAKGGMSQHILKHFPRAEAYLEPFFGGGGMFFAVPLGLYKIETVNDIYKQTINFFRVLRERTDDLLRVIELTPCAWDEFKAALVDTDDELEAARRFWVRSNQGYGTKHKTTEGQWRCASEKVSMTNAVEGRIANIPAFAARIRQVQFDNRDFADFLELRTRPTSFIYADPPYVPEARAAGADDAYVHEMTVEDHRRLADSLHKAEAIGARVCLSGYDCALYAELYPAWRKVTFEMPLRTKCQVGGKMRTVTETLWMNYPEAEEIGERIAVVPKASAAKTKQEHSLLVELRRRMVRGG